MKYLIWFKWDGIEIEWIPCLMHGEEGYFCSERAAEKVLEKAGLYKKDNVYVDKIDNEYMVKKHEIPDIL